MFALTWGLTDLYPLSPGTYNQEWTFGQVIALLFNYRPSNRVGRDLC